jgi:hypothetical protein
MEVPAGLPAAAFAGVGAPVASTAAPAAATAAPATAAAATRFIAGTRFVDTEGSSVHLLAIEGANRGFAFLLAAHGDESESPGAPGFAIGHNFQIGNSPSTRKGVAQGGFGGLERKVPNEESHGDRFILTKTARCTAGPGHRVSGHQREHSSDDLPRYYELHNQSTGVAFSREKMKRKPIDGLITNHHIRMR